MIAYVEGKLKFKSPTHVHIDIGGLAYEVQISLNSYSLLESLEEAKLFTQLIVRDDAHTLFGFMYEEEKELFNYLISVSGVGPNTARVILSYMTAQETAQAIIIDDVAAFKKVKGVGPKTAQRIILDLKDKLLKLGLEVLRTGESRMDLKPSIKEEAISALVALGFQKSTIVKQVDKVMSSDNEIEGVESLIKSVLRQLS